MSSENSKAAPFSSNSSKIRSSKITKVKIARFSLTVFSVILATYITVNISNLYFGSATYLSPLNELLQKAAPNTSLHRILVLLKNNILTQKELEETVLKIDPKIESERCARYGYKYGGRKSRRRIFLGSLIAEDSWHPIAAHAAEAYGLYHTVAFTESSTTTSSRQGYVATRELRFTTGSFDLKVLQSGIFGPSTKVTVDFYHDDKSNRIGHDGKEYFLQEDLQREVSLKRFKQNGMTTDDIAIFSDLDEVFSRDFLLAAQICEIPSFVKGQNCRYPKIVASAMTFEATPECVTSNRLWFHPDMVIGECVDTIGDSNIHKPLKRLFKDKGRRLPGYGKDPYDYFDKKNLFLPLWQAVDFRTTPGGDMLKDVDGNHIAFHFRNFFDSIHDVRYKFATCTHAKSTAWTHPLRILNPELNMTVNCVKGDSDPEKAENIRLDGGFAAIQGPTPVIFKDEIYRKLHFLELQKKIEEDEKKYGA